MSPYLTRLDAHFDARYSAHTKRNWLGQARKFLTLCGEKPEYARADLLAYQNKLVLAGYKASSIGSIMTAIRALFDVNELKWPLEKRDMRLGLPEEEGEAPALSVDDITKLIACVRDQPGFPRTVTALATIFGLRGDEIVRVFAAGCDGTKLSIQTAKGGRKREHVIPPALKHVFTTEKMKVSTRSLHELFEKLMRENVRPALPREGWHACRRSVVTALFDAKVREEVIIFWMGWKGKSIAIKYFRPNQLDVDKQVYLAHPYLRVWVK